MKKNLVLILIVCSLVMITSCSLNNTEESSESTMTNHGEGEFRGVVTGYNIDLNDSVGANSDFSINDKLALEIGDAVLKQVYGKNKLSKTIYYVMEIAKEDFYVVTRIPDNDIPGADYNVAINKKDGKILKIWMGE